MNAIEYVGYDSRCDPIIKLTCDNVWLRNDNQATTRRAPAGIAQDTRGKKNARGTAPGVVMHGRWKLPVARLQVRDAQQPELYFIRRAAQFGMQLQPRSLKILHLQPMFDNKLADRQAEDR